MLELVLNIDFAMDTASFALKKACLFQLAFLEFFFDFDKRFLFKWYLMI